MTTFYGTTVLGNAYWLERGIEVTLTNADLIIASEWLDANFGASYSGYKTGERSQEREQPRTGQHDVFGYDIPSDEVPAEVLRATYEVAYRNNRSPGSLNTDVTLAKNVVKAAVSGAVSVEYAGAASIEDLQLSIPMVAKILAPILTGDHAGYSELSSPSVRV